MVLDQQSVQSNSACMCVYIYEYASIFACVCVFVSVRGEQLRYRACRGRELISAEDDCVIWAADQHRGSK